MENGTLKIKKARRSEQFLVSETESNNKTTLAPSKLLELETVIRLAPQSLK